MAYIFIRGTFSDWLLTSLIRSARPSQPPYFDAISTGIADEGPVGLRELFVNYTSPHT